MNCNNCRGTSKEEQLVYADLTGITGVIIASCMPCGKVKSKLMGLRYSCPSGKQAGFGSRCSRWMGIGAPKAHKRIPAGNRIRRPVCYWKGLNVNLRSLPQPHPQAVAAECMWTT
jgi:hypothetical protein